MKFKKLCSILGVALILSLLIMPMLAGPASAQSAYASPNHGVPGETIQIIGNGFGGGAIWLSYPEKSFADRFAIVSSDFSGDFEYDFVIPDEPGGTKTLYIYDKVSFLWEEVTFTIDLDTEIDLDSASGHVGDEITFDGEGFLANEDLTIYFDDEEIGSAESDDDGEIDNASFTVPPSVKGGHTIKVQAGSTNYATATFSTRHQLTDVEPTSGSVGDIVTVSGDGFKADADIDVSFTGTVVTTTVSDDNGSFSTSFAVPVVANGIFKVKVSDGTNQDEADFSVAAGFSINPTIGNIGTQVTVKGAGFITGGAITVSYDNETVTTGTVDNKGSFSITLEVPTSQHGNHVIKATDGTNTMAANFAMESQAPAVPQSQLPYDGVKVESPATFDWADVTDPSGVTYTLQIASDKDFSQVVLEKIGLETSGYTLTSVEKLESTEEDAPYYWRVQAVDGAENESGWTAPGSFYVGFAFNFEFTGWILYVAIGLGGLLLLGIGFWLGRSTGSYY